MVLKPRRTFIIALSLLFLFSSCTGRKEKIFRKSSVIMDTLVTITVVSESDKNAEQSIEKAFDEIKRLEKALSFWSPESEIAEVYKNAGVKPVKVSGVTLDVIEKALFVSDKTGGAFDATIGPVIRLYDFKKKTRPDMEKLKETLPLVSYKEMSIDKEKSTAFLRKKGMSFDTGGILKGYAADNAVEALKREGIRSGLVAIAGDIRAFGLKPDGRGWNIGIRNPRGEKDDDILATVELRDEAVSTSGDYERFFIEGEERYHHLLDPKTGYPTKEFMSVSVIAKEGVYTDGFSTGVFVMGPERGLGLVKKLSFEAVTVDSSGKIFITEGIRDRVKVSDPNGQSGRTSQTE